LRIAKHKWRSSYLNLRPEFKFFKSTWQLSDLQLERFFENCQKNLGKFVFKSPPFTFYLYKQNDKDCMIVRTLEELQKIIREVLT